MNRGLPKVSGAVAKRERQVVEAGCGFKECGEKTAALIYTVEGPGALCNAHGVAAAALGWRTWPVEAVTE